MQSLVFMQPGNYFARAHMIDDENQRSFESLGFTVETAPIIMHEDACACWDNSFQKEYRAYN